MPSQETILFIMQAITFGGVAFAIYKQFRDPDAKAAEEIAVMKERCDLKHQYIDDNILMIKENHLRHIESDIVELKQGQVRIETILEERLPKSKN